MRQYRSRISGPLLDRFDLHIEVPRISLPELTAGRSEPAVEALRGLVRHARDRQLARGNLNSRLSERDVITGIDLDRGSRGLLSEAQQRWQLSTRSVVRILKVARTLADLAERTQPTIDDVSEALHLRRLDRPLTTDTV